MGRQARYDYIKAMRNRYQKAETKACKGRLLNEVCEMLGYNRSYAIRLLNHKQRVQKSRPGRKKFYGDDLLVHIRFLWEQMEFIGAKRMAQALRVWLKFYNRAPDGTPCTAKQKWQLGKISAAQLGRLLKKIRGDQKGISSTQPNYALKKKIPIEILTYEVSKPGAVQADTVVHCGNTMFGKYATTLTITDVFSGWTENRAIWTKDSKQVRDQIESIEGKLPFTLHTFATDCGSEFLNFRVMNYLMQRRKPIHMTRSRPYHKDDNAFVEQKNWTHVRQLFGYDRINNKELIDLMNDIYENHWNLLHNFFFPSIKLIKKERVGGKVKKKYDIPKTPFHRILSSDAVTESQKTKLKSRYNQLNPFELKTEMEKKLKSFFKELKKSNSRKKAA